MYTNTLNYTFFKYQAGLLITKLYILFQIGTGLGFCQKNFYFENFGPQFWMFSDKEFSQKIYSNNLFYNKFFKFFC